jgi:hypothetical protein
MKTIDVVSSQFKKAAYNDETKELFIVFNNDSIYKYSDVPVEIFEGIDSAESKGSYFIQKVKKGGFAYDKVDEISDVKPMKDLRETPQITAKENSDINIPDDKSADGEIVDPFA